MHCSDYKRTNMFHRKLYSAMNEYGIEHFSITDIEVINNDRDLYDREIYWIKKYDSFLNGYNDTLGGSGKRRINREDVLSLWFIGHDCRGIAKITGHDSGMISKILKEYGITEEDFTKRRMNKICKKVCKIDPATGEIVGEYASVTEACLSCGPVRIGHIADVCTGKRKSSGGYKWAYVTQELL